MLLGELLSAGVALEGPDFHVDRRDVLGQVVLPGESVHASVTLPVPLLLLPDLPVLSHHDRGLGVGCDQVGGPTPTPSSPSSSALPAATVGHRHVQSIT